jgi:mannose-6-phosphate isomerase-like protein (cupin superfamily)
VERIIWSCQNAAILALNRHLSGNKWQRSKSPESHESGYNEATGRVRVHSFASRADQTPEVKAGGIVVIPANMPHRFVDSGETPLRQIDIHASPKFIQVNL